MRKQGHLLGIRGQFLLLLGAVILFVATSTTMLATHSQRSSLLLERKLRGSSVLRSWSSLCRQRLLSDESVNLSMWDFVDDMMKHESAIEQIYLVDTAGTILMHNDQSRLGSRCPAQELRDLGSRTDTGISEEKGPMGVHLRFQQTIVVSGRRLGYAVVVFSSAGIESGIKQSMIYMVLVASGIGFVGMLLASILVYQVTRPIQLLVDGVKRFGEKFDPEDPQSADVKIQFLSFNEIGDVRDSFNSMTSALSRSMSERKRLKEETGALRVQASTDGMTGLLNKRQFQEEFPVLLQLAAKKDSPLCLMLLDMDHFKQLNDTMGHG
ncbi:MAG TPA: diguanylate cyclase, partial [Fibrobacteria bacterium]|nr:diguanylate cyclase [Fibrobacteria bacterium]